MSRPRGIREQTIRNRALSPVSRLRKITVLIEAHAPKYNAPWWNIDQDEAVFPKYAIRSIYKLARDGWLESKRKQARRPAQSPQRAKNDG
jgi:hypothetical protein